jgi:hypothetical protein
VAELCYFNVPPIYGRFLSRLLDRRQRRQVRSGCEWLTLVRSGTEAAFAVDAVFNESKRKCH